MNNILIEIASLILFSLIIFGLMVLKKKKFSFTKRVFTALGMSIVFGLILKFLISPALDDASFKDLINWISVVGTSYTTLLKMIVVPLIMVSIISAIVNLDKNKNLTKIVSTVIAILIMTTVVSAFVGVIFTNTFKLDASEIVKTEAIENRAETLKGAADKANITIQEKLVSFLPVNPFADMAGARGTSTIAVVIFSALLGIGALSLKKEESLIKFKDGVNLLNDVIIRIVALILRMTPYGVFALLSRTIATTNYEAIVQLGKFVLASYLALVVMFIIQLISVKIAGISIRKYIKKVMPVLIFAFTSRSSAASIPLNSSTQHESLGVDKGIASISASIGATVGQNGWAGVYPAMLAVMIAPTVGIDPTGFGFLLQLAAIIAITSFGVAGVGGGATFAAIMVLSAMGLPIELAAVLIAVEPLIDMGRTMINVNGAMAAGTITAISTNLLDEDTLNSETLIDAK